MIKINAGYIKRLQTENKILFLFALKDLNTNQKTLENQISSFNDFKSEVKEISKRNREYIFSYFDSDQDNYLTNFFKLNKSNLPCLILYDFSNRRYAIDYSDFNSVKNLRENFLKIKDKLEANKLQWAHGNWFQDLLAKIGINLTERGSLILLGCFFIFILLVLIFVLFCFGETNDEEFDIKKRQFIEQLAASKDLHEEEKKLILDSKNFDSLVKMGLDKIIENLKSSINEEDKQETEEEDIIKMRGNIIVEKPLVDNLNSINNTTDNEDKSQILETKKNK